MEIINGANITRFQKLTNGIRENVDEWKVVDIIFDERKPVNTDDISKKLDTYFGVLEGYMFICSSKEILVLVMLGKSCDLQKIKQDVQHTLPDYKCKISVGQIARDGLQTIELRLKQVADLPSMGGGNCLPMRKFVKSATKKYFLSWMTISLFGA
jgi:hypothetical protein